MNNNRGYYPAINGMQTNDAVIRQLLAETTFRRLDAPELPAEGVVYVNGKRVKPSLSTAEKKAVA